MQKKRRTSLIIFLLIVLGFIIFFLVRYISFLNNKDPDKTFILPRLDETIIEITSITREKTIFKAHMLLNNPLPFRIGADSIAYEFFINDSSVLKTSYRQNVQLKAADTSWVSIPVTVQNQKLVSILNRSDSLGFDSVYYEVRGSFYSHALKEKKFNFRYGRMLPLIHLPDVEITKAEVDSANLKRFKLLIHAKIQNHNLFPINARDISFRFAVSGHPFVKGMRPGLLTIPADSTIEIIFPVTVSLLETTKVEFAILRHGKKVPYVFEADLKVVSDQNVLNNSELMITSEGTIKEIVDFVRPPKATDSR
jgi:LEA14-like dessication related protein